MLIGMGAASSRTPATPPAMRVRTRRFEKLRPCLGNAKIVEGCDDEDASQSSFTMPHPCSGPLAIKLIMVFPFRMR